MSTYTLPNGIVVHSINSRSVDILDFNIGRDSDIADEFVSKFLMNAKNENIAVNRHRMHMMDKFNIDFESFASMYNNNKKNCLEQLFRHSVTNEEINRLTDLISNGSLSLRLLFDKHKREPKSFLIKFLL